LKDRNRKLKIAVKIQKAAILKKKSNSFILGSISDSGIYSWYKGNCSSGTS